MKKQYQLPFDLMIILIWEIIIFIFILIPVLNMSSIRATLGITGVLFIPGYVLTTALFPRKDALQGIERLVLSFGLSIGVVPLLGLMLNFTYGIRLIPISLTLALYITAMTAISAWRRNKLPEEDRFSVSFHKFIDLINVNFNTPGSKMDKNLTIILIFLILLAAGMIYFVITTPKIGERFTEFYILGPYGKAENYPSKLKINSPVSVLVGVVNNEFTYTNYTIKVALNEKVLDKTRFSIDHNQTWENNLTFTPDSLGTDMKLEFWLFKEDNFTVPYRKLHLWVNVTK